MKTRFARTRMAPPVRNKASPRSSSSLLVLASLGLLSFALPLDVLAQRMPAPNTLPVLRSVVSDKSRTKVNAPTLTAGGRSLLAIDQLDQRAIIDWRSFDIGSNAEVLFRQPGVTASVLNRIYDAVPSVIQGRLSSIGPNGTAGGQIILINQNGILFNRGAQVNTQSLVASSLNMSNARFMSGALTNGGLTSAAFEGGYALDGDGTTLPMLPGGARAGSIVIGGAGDAGAAAPVLQANAGGLIMIFAPIIDNQGGVIKAPDGQVILAAGSKAYLALNEDTKNLTLRGFVVEVAAEPDGPGRNLTSLVRNSGDISADRGNVTLAGLAVNQNGRVSASTAIQANGSIYLKAKTLGDAQAGTVSLGAGSRTEVLPDANDRATMTESQSYADRRGEITVQGRTIDSSGTLMATGGRITLDARDAADPTGARVYLGAGSVTSVAGNWVDVPFADNLLTFKVTSNELKDSPDQKSGILKGATVTVDLRKGSPLLNLDAYVAAQTRTVAQKTAVGGVLDISSSGSLIQRSGATLDASGGGYRYGAGTAATSVLLGADGRLYDIGSAAQMRPYSGQIDSFTKRDARWGQTQVFRGGTYGIGKAEAAYLEGKAGGSVSLTSAAGLVLDGHLKGGVTVGPNQLASAPRGATLKIGNFRPVESDFDAAQRIGHVNFKQQASDTLGAAFNVATSLSSAQVDSVALAAEQLFGKAGAGGPGVYVQNSFDAVEINANGRIVVPADVHVDGAPGSSLVLRSPQIDIAGAITMPAGGITLQPVASVVPFSNELSNDRDSVTLRSGASLSTAGVWINNASADGSFVGDPLPSGRLNVVLNTDGSAGTPTTTSTLNGGRITIATDAPGTSATVLESGASLDVGGGAALSSTRRVTAGDGGTLSIANGLSSSLNPDWLLADLSGFSVGNGGQLVLTTPRVELAAADARGTVPANTTRLMPELFSDHGFSSVSINANQGIAINAGATIKLKQRNRVIDALEASSLATGGDLRRVSTVEELPDDRRQAVNLTLSTGAGQTQQARLTMAEGSSILADPRAAITFSAVDGMQIDGRIVAPGGTVSLNLSAPDIGAPDLSLGSTAAISVAGVFVPRPNASGLDQGSVIGGGVVTIAASRAGVNLAAGSSIDVSGVNHVVQSLGTDKGSPVINQSVDGNAGALIVRSQGAAELKSTLHAASGSVQGAGGAFALELNAWNSQLEAPPERRIVVTQHAPGAAPVPDPAFVDAMVSVDDLKAAGFQKLRLQSENRIELRGDTNLDFARGIRLDAPLIDVTGDGRASLQGASVALGQSLDPRNTSGVFDVVQRGTSPVLPTRSGSGVLSVQADTIDLFGSFTINGISQARLFSEGDIRMTGRNVLSSAPDRALGAQVGSLTTTGDILLSAAQVYPSTRTDFTLAVVDQPTNNAVAGGKIVIASNGKTAGDVYSAGGRLALVADNIVQGGTVKAPLGEIDLRAGSKLELSPGSVTSVSAKGLTIPFGSTSSGISWSYQDNSSGTANLLTTGSADGKRIELVAKDVDVRAGAVVDLSGGGDVQAIEFVPGIGGSRDTLARPGTFAIIPKSLLSSMPVDTDTAAAQDIGFGFQTRRYDTSVFDQLHIGSGAVVPEGDYVLLPARYALLPNAYLVQLQTGGNFAQMGPGQTTQLLNGQTVVAGYRIAAGTSIRESSTVGVVVRPGSAVTRESDYTLTTSGYFTDQASNNRTALPRVPIDAGHLVVGNPLLTPIESLKLDGSFATAPGAAPATAGASGRLAEVDITAPRIALVDHANATDIRDADGNRFLQVEGASLSALGGSLLLGGQRNVSGNSVQITTGADEIIVANSAAGALKAPELLLSAKGSIEVRSGSVLTAVGTAAEAASTIIKADSDGALLRLSSGAQVGVDRGAIASNPQGDIRVREGAVLTAGGSILLDATRTTESKGTLAVARGGALSLASSLVSLEATAGTSRATEGLVLSNSDLSHLADLGALTIKGYKGIDLYGDVAVGRDEQNALKLASLTLDAQAIRGHGASVEAGARLEAGEVRLINSGVAGSAGSAVSSGQLSIDAQRVVIGAGTQVISGYSSVTMTGRSEIVAQGQGSMAVAGDWTLSTPKVGVEAGAAQSWRAVDVTDAANPVYSALTLASRPGTAGTSTDAAAGGRLGLEAQNVTVGTTVQARSGQIGITAHGTGGDGGVTLVNGALLDVHGQSKNFNGRIVTADGGSVSLMAGTGAAVTVQAGAKLDVSAAAQGGGAGLLAVRADSMNLFGELAGRAGAGATSGSVDLDLDSLTGFSALNAGLNAGGFAEERRVRVRQGDIAVAAGDDVAARKVSLSADQGRIDVAGTVGSGAAQGGAQVDLWAATGLRLAAGSRILANAGDDHARGGVVNVATRSGVLEFDGTSGAGDAALIDVRAGRGGAAGSVNFGVSRDADNTMGATKLEGLVKRWSVGSSPGQGSDAPASVNLLATRSYDVGGNLSAEQIASFATDHESFVTAQSNSAATSALRDETGSLAGARVRGTTELKSEGDLLLDRAWDLTTAQWLAGDQPGTLTLRAGGNLTVTQSIGAPDDNILAGESWSLRLVGGADLSAANALATQAVGAGSVLLSGDNAKLRTGTGSIQIAAATDFSMDSAKSVVYTAGRIGAADTERNSTNRWSRDGGSISIEVGRDATGASNEFITEWLRRLRTSSASEPAQWWAFRPNFQQGVGTLGGGDIRIDAGRDVKQLSAMLPTTGRNEVVGEGDAAVNRLDVQGGGDLRVRAGNDVIGGSYLVGRGDGRIAAGGDVGGASPTQLFLMGVSSGDVAAEANVSVSAGGSVALQSVNNPTVIFQVPGSARNPGNISTSSQSTTFFTYSPDSSVRLLAQSGDVSIGSLMARTRLFANSSTGNGVETDDRSFSGAFPASLLAASLDGNVALTDSNRQIVTFPSPTAQVALLAGDSLISPNLTVSGRAPDSVRDVSRPGLSSANTVFSGLDLQVSDTSGQIVERLSFDGFRFDFQALTGDVRGGTGELTLPGKSRVRAGRDINGLAMRLQNLDASDVTEVRADTGDVAPSGIEIRGPGTLLVQAGRNVDVGTTNLGSFGVSNLGGIIATGNKANPDLSNSEAARLTLIAGVTKEIDLSLFKAAYDDLIALNGKSDTILAFYRELNGDPNRAAVLNAGSIQDLASRDKTYAPYVALLSQYPGVLTAYQTAGKTGSLPLGTSAEATQAARLYALLNSETDASKIVNVRSVADLVNGSPGGSAYAAYVALDAAYPRVFADYRARRSRGALPQGLTPILLSDVMNDVTAKVVPADAVSRGSIDVSQSSIQTHGNGRQPDPDCVGQCASQGDIDLWVPGGGVLAGLTTPPSGTTIGVLTNSGGGIRSVVADDFIINQGKVLTVQGGDILIYSSGGSVDAGRGAKTSVSTPPPTRTPIRDPETGAITGFSFTLPASASGSGIQTLTSDPDGVGPRNAPSPGSIFLYAPAGTVDAGEAGIRSSGNIVINAQTVLNASNISSSGSSSGVPLAVSGSLASSLAASGGSADSGAKGAQDAAKNAADAARAATAAGVQKPNILTVEVLGFGDKNCKEQEKDCFAK